MATIARDDQQPADPMLALHTAEFVQRTIRHADTKIAAISSVVLGGAALLAGRVTDLATLAGADVWMRYAAGVLTAIAIAGLAGAAWFLADALRPRLDTAGGTGRLGPADGDFRELVEVLSRIAIAKHLRVRRSLNCLIVAAAAMIGWELLIAVPALLSHAG
ncbi:hypothetical protein [Winogradskya humida]|uniref:Superfamily III holin-X n=1 Tax=Winogradskya humida TaxID=113566 RepID=A0ABQ3ZQC7_9ACTN|nr:hypothetical protein [Actinoplanes humidus]GIE20772.1 hypothetical protein Ahu01nite_038740 [Actinoplanes humidus]